MPEETKTATDKESISDSEINPGATDSQDPEQAKAEEKQGGEGEKAETKGDGSVQPDAQSRAKNAEYAKKRREAEAKAKADREAETQRREQQALVKGKIEGLNGKNPYTEEPITNEYELHIYEVMKKLDDAGKDPIKHLAKALADEHREQTKAQAEEQAKQKAESDRQAQSARESREKAISDIKALKEAYPSLKTEEISELIKSDLFREKAGRWTLREIYEYQQANAGTKSGIKLPNAKPSTPSSATGGSNTPKSIMDMTDEEFLAYKAKRNRW